MFVSQVIFFHDYCLIDYILKITAHNSLDQHSLILVSIPIKLSVTSCISVLEKSCKVFMNECNMYKLFSIY